MTLYNKDGSIYKLSAPNPIMKEQQIWSKFVVHNMKWKPEYREDGTVVLPLESDLSLEPKTQTEIFLSELTDSKEEKKPEVTPEPIEPVSKVEKSINTKNDIKKTFIYCLPANIKEKKDNLYGEIFKKLEYEKPTSFEAVIISQGDMLIEMWSDVYFEQGSILYPRNGDKRWWKINEVSPKLGGWIIKGLPSQDQPSFES
jgi:hypothetical protein